MKKTCKRAFFVAVLVSLVIASFSACKLGNIKNEEITINAQVKNYLDELGITQYKISGEMQFKEKELDLTLVTCNKHEIKKWITSVLDDYGHLEECKKRKKVKKGDFVTISLYFTGTQKNIYGQELKVGSGYYDNNIEDKLEGKKKGQKFAAITDESIPVSITVEKIQKYVIPKLDDAFVKKEFGCSSVKQYKQKVRHQILLDKLNGQIKKEEESYIDEILKEMQVYGFSTDEIANYAYEKIVQKDKVRALSMGYSFPGYIDEAYQVTESDYYNRMYIKAEKDISEIIAVGAGAEKLGICIRSDNSDGMADNYEKIKEKFFDCLLGTSEALSKI